MKIATISINFNTHDLNYGAALHSWAFQHFLVKYKDVDTEIIDFIPRCHENTNLSIPPMRSCIKSLGVGMYNHMKRYEKFKMFIENNVKTTARKYNEAELSKVKLDYDAIVCESDVIWTPYYCNGFQRAFFLSLDNMKGLKKVAYAASMGNAELTATEEKEIIALTKDIDCISVREKYAATYLSRITGRNIVTVLDPVLLLNEQDYADIIAPRVIDVPYLLIYIPLSRDPMMVSLAKDYAKQHNLLPIEVSFNIRDMFRHKIISTAGIEEFLSLVKNATCIFTNSFHAVCFAVLFKRDFYVFSRRTGLKYKDLCERLGLMERYVENNDFRKMERINWNNVYTLLNKEKDYSIAWICNSLGINADNTN